MFALTCGEFGDGGRIPLDQVHFDAGGKNISPSLSWTGAPAGTKSFAVTCHDPDAPTGSGWWHWVVFNLYPSVTSLPAGIGGPARGAIPGAVQGVTDYGTAGWGGPCPPPGHGDHRYVFTVHALSVEHLDLPAGASAAKVGFNLWANRLASASLTGLYGR